MQSMSGGRGGLFGGLAWAVIPAALAALLLCASAACAAERTQGWWLVVKGAACVAGPKVLVGDIAEPRGDLPKSQWKSMAARPLWKAPARAGHQIALSRERLVILLQQYAEDLAPACSLPPQIVIQRGGEVADARALTRRVVTFLTERMAHFGGETDVTDVHVPDYIFLPGPHDRLDLSASAPVVKPGRVNVLFTLRAPGGRLGRRFAASGFVNVWKALPVAARGLCRRERLNLADVRYKRKNLAYNEDAWDGQGGPWRMVRNVGVGQVISRADLGPVPVVMKGAKVDLVFERPGIRLSVKAEALSDGGLGETIQVRNLQSNRKISAKVLDADTVIVR